MGYRGEDASRTRADSRRQPPWRSSSGTGAGATASRNDGSRGYGQDGEYAADDGYGGYPRDDSYAGYEAYGQGARYGQLEEYGQQADHGVGGNDYQDGYGHGVGYGRASGDGQFDDYGYPRGNGHTPGDGYAADDGYPPGNDYARGGGYPGDGYPAGNGYAHSADYPGDAYAPGDGYPPDDGYAAGTGYGQSQGYGGYGQQPQAGYETHGGGYRDGYSGGGFGDAQHEPSQPGADYPVSGYARSGGYPALPAGSGHSGDYPAQPGGYAQSGGYPALPAGSGHSGDYPVQGTGSADRDDVPGRYAGSDWYVGQPTAASGSGFADTGTYNMDARIIDSYGTGPRAAEHGTGGYAEHGTGGYDPGEHETNGYELGGHRDGYQGGTHARLAVRGYPPSAAALPARPEAPVPQGLVHTGQQERYDDEYESYPRYDDQDEFDDRQNYDAGHEDEAFQRYDDYDEPAGFGTRGYDTAAGPGIPGGYDDYANDGDPYRDRYGDDGTAPRPASRTGSKSKAGKNVRDKAGRGRGRRPLLLAALAVVAVGVLGVAAYTFVLKPKPSAGSQPSAAGPLPTTGSTSAATAACVKQFGEYCHIELRTDDPKPLTLDELFPQQFLNETDHASFMRVAARLDKTCANAVIGQDLVNSLQSGKCTQVLRASYVSGDNKIMGTIGVVNLATTNEAHYAGKVVGANNFVTPLNTSKGIASKLGKGTGVVEAEFKGHYLILTWAEFTSTTAPKTKAQDQQLEHFENDLVAGTANISLSQRMVNGAPATAAG